jgi:hypothetical protein
MSTDAVRDNNIPEIARFCVICELLYVAEGTALDDVKTAKFCIQRIQQLVSGSHIPLLLRDNIYREKLAKVVQMIKENEKKVVLVNYGITKV